MNKLKFKKISSVLSIVKRLKPAELDYFILNTNDDTIQIILETIYNLIFNNELINRINNKKLLEKVRASMRDNKNKWCGVVKSKSKKNKRGFIRNQIGGGVITDICSLILPVVLGLL